MAPSLSDGAKRWLSEHFVAVLSSEASHTCQGFQLGNGRPSGCHLNGVVAKAFHFMKQSRDNGHD